MRALMMIDDWSTLASTALPYIYKFGKPVVEELFEKYVKPKGMEWL